MAVSERAVRAEAWRLSLEGLLRHRQAFLLFAGFTLGTIFLRAPSFFEPPWHTDEGIFSAVAQRVIHGGRLYADAWESKPPLFIYIYVGLIKAFGAGVLPLRIATTVSAIGTELALYGIARSWMDRRQSIIAAAVLAIFLAVPFWEGNLALSDTFTILPSTLGVLCVVRAQRDTRLSTSLLLLGGACFGLAFLIRQTAAVVPVGGVIWLLINRGDWLRTTLLIGIGGSIVVLPVVAAFAAYGSFHWFWNANVGFFFRYIPSGHQLPLYYRPLTLLPVGVACYALFVYNRRGETPRWGLPALWLTLTLAAAMLTGRPYPHYFLPVFVPLSLLIAMIAPHVSRSWRPVCEQRPALALAAAVALLWFGGVTPEFGNPYAFRNSKVEGYYPNFAGYALGIKNDAQYDNYFDKRVLLSERLATTLEGLGANGKSVYIWGEYPWGYALSGAMPATAYTTSFYVLLIPDLDTQLDATLREADPTFIVMLIDAWPRYQDDTGILQRRYRNSVQALNGLISERYVEVADVGRARIFGRVPERPLVSENQGLTR